jgi:hypothetical protein
MFVSTNKTNDMTIEETIQMINLLKAENNPINDELIAFYERKVKEAYANAINKAFKQGV